MVYLYALPRFLCCPHCPLLCPRRARLCTLGTLAERAHLPLGCRECATQRGELGALGGARGAIGRRRGRARRGRARRGRARRGAIGGAIGGAIRFRFRARGTRRVECCLERADPSCR